MIFPSSSRFNGIQFSSSLSFYICLIFSEEIQRKFDFFFEQSSSSLDFQPFSFFSCFCSIHLQTNTGEKEREYCKRCAEKDQVEFNADRFTQNTTRKSKRKKEEKKHAHVRKKTVGKKRKIIIIIILILCSCFVL